MTKEELKIILEKHEKWLKNEEGGECANLTGANLEGANLEFVDLRFSNLAGANLQNADLYGASLRNANLSHSYLRNAKNLDYAFIRLIDLKDAITK